MLRVVFKETNELGLEIWEPGRFVCVTGKIPETCLLLVSMITAQQYIQQYCCIYKIHVYKKINF